MGKTSKPLSIHIDNSLYESEKEYWDTLIGQGFIITNTIGQVPDIYFAPYAMRMTSDMMQAMPSAVALAIKGARELRYAPHGAEPKGKKNAKVKTSADKKPAKKAGKHVTGGEQPAAGVCESPAPGTCDVTTSGEYIL